MSPAPDTSPPSPDATGYDPARVDRVRLVVAARRQTSAHPDEAYVLEVTPERIGDRWDERPYVAALASVLAEAGGPTRVGHTWRVERRVEHPQRVGGPEASAEALVSLTLTLPPGSGGRVSLPAETVRTALRSAPAAPRPPAEDEVSRTRREVALAAARRFAATTRPGCATGELDVADEEHRSDQGVWAFGLVAHDGTRFDVEVGVVGRRSGSARVTRFHRAEVVDSLGVE